VERTFPVHAPTIAKIEVESYGDVRRAKLYYLVICVERPPRSRSSASPSVPSPLGEEELDDYESTLELALVQSTKPWWACSTSPWRRPAFLPRQFGRGRGPLQRHSTLLEITLTDAWVWDMYRAARFVPSVRVLTFRDVNIERLPKEDLQP